jgi:SAM-dependent methyltransferase
MSSFVGEQAMIRDEMERIYSEIPPAEIPWNLNSPPSTLVQLVESGQIHPCRTLDMGCGAGNYAIYLAGLGFDVTGVDISPSAIALAQANAKKQEVVCNFTVADVLSGLEELPGVFEFAYDWALLHHVFPDQRDKYVETVHRLLVPGGKYLSVCFSDEDDAFGGTGKYRTTSLGTTLYFSSEEELRELFEPHFTVKSLKTVEVEGTWKPHRMNAAFMEKCV